MAPGGAVMLWWAKNSGVVGRSQTGEDDSSLGLEAEEGCQCEDEGGRRGMTMGGTGNGIGSVHSLSTHIRTGM